MDELLIANLTLLRSFSPVGAQVIVQMTGESEAPATHAALVWFLIRVDDHVHGEMARPTKSLAADLAPMSLDARVDEHVSVEVVAPAE